jgi:hypothetical protein
MNDDEFRHKIFEFVVEEVNANNPIELDGNPIEIVNIVSHFHHDDKL